MFSLNINVTSYMNLFQPDTSPGVFTKCCMQEATAVYSPFWSILIQFILCIKRKSSVSRYMYVCRFTQTSETNYVYGGVLAFNCSSANLRFMSCDKYFLRNFWKPRTRLQCDSLNLYSLYCVLSRHIAYDLDQSFTT